MIKRLILSAKKTAILFPVFFIAMSFFLVPISNAQDFYPPTVLPADDTYIEGYGDACIGLADAIRTGNLHLRQIPCFIKYFSQTLIAIAGTLSVIFVIIGGYKYILGADAKKDDAKRTILFALIGLAVSLMAWILVDVILQFITE
jgi:hypothetical protein